MVSTVRYIHIIGKCVQIAFLNLLQVSLIISLVFLSKDFCDQSTILPKEILLRASDKHVWDSPPWRARQKTNNNKEGEKMSSCLYIANMTLSFPVSFGPCVLLKQIYELYLLSNPIKMCNYIVIKCGIDKSSFSSLSTCQKMFFQKIIISNIYREFLCQN